MRDPHYRKILEGLSGPLDPAVFEACAADLLRDVYPGLVPIQGGGDYGMDGAIADGKGEAFPLMVTTAQDVLSNLTTNLDSYVAGGGRRRRAVVATSIALTPKRRKNIERRADEKGFVLVQIHEKRDFADRLYRSSRWALELLGVTSEPSALSEVPLTRRPLREGVPLIGRDADLAWLNATAGDRLVVGQPGSGKTYLLLQLVRQGKALFLASQDEGRIAKDLRDLHPGIVIVDDAHSDLDALVRLRRMRVEAGVPFEIIATGWPGTESDVLEALGLETLQTVRRLELLSWKQILEVLRAIGIGEPNDDPDLKNLVTQSARKPGLAVTLGSLWLRGEWQEVLSGQAVRQNLIPALKRFLDHDPTELLACFALGGDGGMSLETVRDFLGLGLEKARQRVALASQGGLLTVRGPDKNLLTVEPEALRYPLIHQVFFASQSLPYRDLLHHAPDTGKAVEVLVIAALWQVPVPRTDLRELVAEHGTTDAWRYFAQLGQDEGRWVLENYRGPLSDIARAALSTAPRATILRLLEDAEEASGPLHSQPDHPLRILQDWTQEIPFVKGQTDRIVTDELVRRRGVTIGVAQELVETAGGTAESRLVAARAALLALGNRMRSVRQSAVGDSVTLHHAALPASLVPEILALWEQVAELISSVAAEVWPELRSVLREWVSPFPPVADRDREELLSVPRKILLDLQRLPSPSLGLRSVLKEWGDRLGLRLSLDLDAEFEVLFPPPYRGPSEGARADRERQIEEAGALAARWVHHPSDKAAGRLAAYEREARAFRNQYSHARLAFFRALAEQSDCPESWAQELIRSRIDANCVQLFLLRVVTERRPAWEDILNDSLSSEEYSSLAADVVIRTEGLPGPLIDRVFPFLWPGLVEAAFLQGEVPLETKRCLLAQPNPDIALAAAIGEWLADPEGLVPAQLEEDWRSAILRAGAGEVEIDSLPSYGSIHWLQRILESDQEIALSWLQARLEDANQSKYVREGGVYASALQALGLEARVKLVERLEPSYLTGQLIGLVVAGSEEVFARVLARPELQEYALEALSGGPADGSWRELAQLALDADYEPERVAAVSLTETRSSSGSETEYLSQWKARFETLRDSAEGGLREVAEHGIRIAEERLAKVQEEKRGFELTGRF